MGHLYISATGKVREFKFGVQIDRQARKTKTAKVGQKGRGISHMTYFYNFGIPSISVRDKARDFKFGVRIERQACNPKNAKLRQKGRGLRHVTYFYNLETSSLSPEWI